MPLNFCPMRRLWMIPVRSSFLPLHRFGSQSPKSCFDETSCKKIPHLDSLAKKTDPHRDWNADLIHWIAWFVILCNAQWISASKIKKMNQPSSSFSVGWWSIAEIGRPSSTYDSSLREWPLFLPFARPRLDPLARLLFPLFVVGIQTWRAWPLGFNEPLLNTQFTLTCPLQWTSRLVDWNGDCVPIFE